MSQPAARISLLRFYVGAVSVAGVASVFVAGWGLEWNSAAVFENGIIAIFAMALGAELTSVGVSVGTSTLSVAFIPFLAATFLFPTFWAMAIAGLTMLVAELLVRKKPWIKVAFNSCKEVLSIGLASSTYTSLGGHASVGPYRFAPLAVLGAGLVYTVANSLSVSIAVSLSEGIRVRAAWTGIYGTSALYDLFAIPLPAALAYLYSTWQLAGVAVLAVPLFVVRHVYAQNIRLQQAHRDLLELMVKQIEARDPYTSGHSQRVSAYARMLAREAGLSARQADSVATAALLHDVGKVYDEFGPLLRKEGKLSAEERTLLQTHPVKSAELVETISNLRGSVSLAVRHHHENFDGSGYPDGLAGEQIPIGARIIMIADTVDAMTTDRPYRKALTFDRVVEQLKKYASTQFDPRLAQLAIDSNTLRRAVLMPAVLPVEHALTSASARAGERAPREPALRGA